MEVSEIIPHIEALIFASDKPLTSLDIVELINNAFGFMEERISLDQVEAAVEGIREKYNAEFYPFEVRESGGGWQFLTKKEFHATVGQLNGDKFLKRLSNAALETLAIIAYKQPITKGEVEAIRGVNSDYSVQKLLEKELIVISGRNENLPGKPLVYGTSKSFMDYFGINDTNDLPKIKEVLAEQMIEATVVNSALNAHEDGAYRENLIDDTPKQQIELFVEGQSHPDHNPSEFTQIANAPIPPEAVHGPQPEVLESLAPGSPAAENLPPADIETTPPAAEEDNATASERKQFESPTEEAPAAE
ncbi:SMC-Scp complex subunit ScpB [Segetibacter sp. 3557_3]|uniref:SMC-Scp complex subunit ScpB n=1 Tax=Segetibacter sp. 3557_3 TaxID=2547429 RepID=UPI001FB75FA6|nr:SMC-Scp complex subunit ScpB [Segetibacter sp. 3557_3]